MTTQHTISKADYSTPKLRFNHPKNYFGVPIAAAAPGDTGALVAAYVVRTAGAAKLGAQTLGLIEDDGETLTERGQHLVDFATDTYGTPNEALQKFEEWHGTSTRLIHLGDGEWEAIAPDLILGYSPAEYIVRVLNEFEGSLTLPQLAQELYRRNPEFAETVFIRSTVDLPEGGSETADALHKPETYRCALACHLKTTMYHCGVLTETGTDSTRISPGTDVWELDSFAPDFDGGEL